MNQRMKVSEESEAEVLESGMGETLESLMEKEGRLDPGRASRIVVGLCDLLGEAVTPRTDLILYKDITLGEIVVDDENIVRLVRNPKTHAEGEMQAGLCGYKPIRVNQIQSVALLYYHLLTGIHPASNGFKLKPFNDLGIYLPGEIFEVIMRAYKTNQSNGRSDLQMLKKDIESFFSTRASQRYQGFSRYAPQQPYTRKRSPITVVGVAVLLTLITLLSFYLIFLWDYPSQSHALVDDPKTTEQPTTGTVKPDVLSPSIGGDGITQPIPQDVKPDTATPPASEGSTPQPGETPPVVDIEDSTPPAAEPSVEPSTPKPAQSDGSSKASKKANLSNLKPKAVRKGYDNCTYSALKPSEDKDIYGKDFSSGIKLQLNEGFNTDFKNQWIEVEYDIGKAYSKLTLKFSLSNAHKGIDATQKAWINIVGDGQLLDSSVPIGSDSSPVEMAVAIKGVKTLKIQLYPASQFIENAAFLIGDAVLVP